MAKGRGPKTEAMPPTPEQIARGGHVLVDIVEKTETGKAVSIGKAFRRKRQVETLTAQGLFSVAEAKALAHYRHHADRADRSPLRDSISGLMMAGYGRGEGEPSRALIHAAEVTRDCERAAGSLADILRAVIVDDVSLSEWAMSRYGSLEERDGKRTRFKPRRKSLEITQLEIVMAAKRVQGELDA